MVKFISANEAIKFFKSGQKIMIGGFLNCGAPTMVIDEILKTNLNDFTLISNDTSFPETDRGKLIANKRVKKAIVSHIGTNSETVNQMNAGTLSVECFSQQSQERSCRDEH